MEVLDCAVAFASTLEMEAQDRRELHEPIRITRLDRLPDLPMEAPAIGLQERGIRGLLNEDVVESVNRLGIDRSDPDEPRSLRETERASRSRRVAGDGFEQWGGHVTPDDSTDPQYPPGCGREPIDPRGEEAGQGRWHLGGGNRLRSDPPTVA
jgi:hypothetical protein